MSKVPPTRVSLHGSHRLQLNLARHHVRRLIAAEHPVGGDGGNLREGCNEFRGPREHVSRARDRRVRLDRRGRQERLTGYSSSFFTIFHEPRHLGASGTLYCSKEQL
jgi:hypothetical protein